MVLGQFDCLDKDYSCARGLRVGQLVLEKADKARNYSEADIMVFVDQHEIQSHESHMKSGVLKGREMQTGELEIVDHTRYELGPAPMEMEGEPLWHFPTMQSLLDHNVVFQL